MFNMCNFYIKTLRLLGIPRECPDYPNIYEDQSKKINPQYFRRKSCEMVVNFNGIYFCHKKYSMETLGTIVDQLDSGKNPNQ